MGGTHKYSQKREMLLKAAETLLFGVHTEMRVNN